MAIAGMVFGAVLQGLFSTANFVEMGEDIRDIHNIVRETQAAMKKVNDINITLSHMKLEMTYMHNEITEAIHERRLTEQLRHQWIEERKALQGPHNRMP